MKSPIESIIDFGTSPRMIPPISLIPGGQDFEWIVNGSNLMPLFGEAIVLKMNKRGRKKLQAIQKFQEILDNEDIQLEVAILSILNLCELLS